MIHCIFELHYKSRGVKLHNNRSIKFRELAGTHSDTPQLPVENHEQPPTTTKTTLHNQVKKHPDHLQLSSNAAKDLAENTGKSAAATTSKPTST